MGMLDGKVAICTGSGRGVGAEVAKLMAANGAKIVVNDPGVGGGGEGGGDAAPAQAIVDEIKAAGGDAVANFGSVTSFENCLDMVTQARDEFGGLHCVFNPAGILRDRMFHKMSPDDWQDVIDVHLTGHYNVNRAAINLFRDQGFGRMIMVSSTSGVLGNVGQANYGAAKMGIVALTRILAMENEAKGITANALLPSADTRMTRSVPTPKDPSAAAVRDERLRRSPADAIAPLCVFLASEEASYVNGQVFHQRGAELTLYGAMRPVRMVHRNGGWTPESIAENGMPALQNGFVNLGDSRGMHPGMPLE
jgi:NAD(P)-dependent dehydrogenase (short-subunit alcohol dehydrogenase family)